MEKFKVTSQINTDVDFFDTMEEVNYHIQAELKSANIYEKLNPWTEEDFNVETVKPAFTIGA